MKNITTIKLSKGIVKFLNKLKIHPRQAYEEVILSLLKGETQDKKIIFDKKGFLGKITTIKLSKETVELLNGLKIHPRQSYEEVVLELLKNVKSGKKIMTSDS